jgi:hypothetical protein
LDDGIPIDDSADFREGTIAMLSTTMMTMTATTVVLRKVLQKS